MDHVVPWYRNHRGSRIFSERPTRDELWPIQAGRLSRFRSCELLSCRKRAARSFNPRSGPLHLDAISWNTACLKPCGSSFQCATTLCPKLRRMSSAAYREAALSGTAARAPPSFSQFESTLELSYRSRSRDFTVLGPLHLSRCGTGMTSSSIRVRRPPPSSPAVRWLGWQEAITGQSKRHWPSNARQAVPLCVNSRSPR